MSDSEGIHDLVAFSRGNAEALGTLTARLDKIEMDNRALRETVAQLVNDATAGSRSAPGPTTRKHGLRFPQLDDAYFRSAHGHYGINVPDHAGVNLSKVPSYS